MRYSRRLSPTGARRNRSRAFKRRASLEALEDRCLMSTVQFLNDSESVNASAGTFSIPVMLSSPPSAPPTISAFASGFNQPGAMAFDSSGNLYAANIGDGTVSEVTPSGKVSTFASGFDGPAGLAFDKAGNLYVANVLGNTVSEVTPAGVVSTFASGFVDPCGLAFDAAGNLYVANYGDGTVREVTPGGTVSTFASGFDGPVSLAFDSSGNLYVSNSLGDTVSEVKGGMVVTFASGFKIPYGLAFDPAGNLYVDSRLDGTVREVTPAGVGSTFASGILEPEGLAFDGGSLYVDSIDDDTVSELNERVAVPFTVGGTVGSGVAFSGPTASPLTFGIGQTTLDITGTLLADPGPSQTLTFTLGAPTGGFVLGSPSVYTLAIAEPAAVQFRTGSETVNASAGTFSIPVTLSGPPSALPTISAFASGFDEPTGLAFDAAGNLYVASDGDGTVEEVSPAGNVINTFSGFDDPQALAFDAAGNLYVANEGNNTVSVLTRTGGTGGTLGAPRTFASGFYDPTGLAFDSAGNLYVANTVNFTDGASVSLVTPAAKVSTFASGLGLVSPVGLAFDAAGNLYVANEGNKTVSKLSPAGAVSTFATTGYFPDSLAFDAAGNLYVANLGDNTVSKVTPAGVVTTFAPASEVSSPAGLAFDAAGNLYVSSGNGTTVSKLSETVSVSVPFTLGGTAAAGVDYSGVTAGVLTFGIGQTTVDITGKLLSDPGPPRTLILALGTPTGGAALGNFSINTLTIAEPAPTPTASPTSTPSPTSSPPPVIIGEQPLLERKTNKKGKPAGKPVLQGFTLEFSRPMGTSAGDSLDYSLERIVARATKKKPAKLRNVGFAVAYSPSDDTVTVNVAGNQAFQSGGLLTVSDAVSSADGVTLSGNHAFAIGKRAKSISPE